MFRIAFIAAALGGLLVAQDPRLDLPADPDALIISLEYNGGYTPVRKAAGPFLSICASGVITVKDVHRASAKNVVTGKLDPAELESLLKFLIVDQKLGDWNGPRVQKALEARRKAGETSLGIEDASTPVVSVHLPNLSMRAELYALSYVASQVPDFKAVTRLEACRRKLHQMATLLRLGGEKGLRPWLKLINTKLEEEHPDQAPFTSADLRHVTQPKDGSMRLSLSRAMTKLEDKRLYVSLAATAAGTAEVTISVIDAR